MSMNKSHDADKAPCSRCPYTLGYVKFVVSPCPQCKMNDYQTYDRLVDKGYWPRVCKSEG